MTRGSGCVDTSWYLEPCEFVLTFVLTSEVLTNPLYFVNPYTSQKADHRSYLTKFKKCMSMTVPSFLRESRVINLMCITEQHL